MCLHGLDILSMWMLFFSLLCAIASAFQHSHLAKDVEVFVTNCMNDGHVLQEWTRCVFYNCSYSLCRPCFLVSLVLLARIQQFCPLFGLHANIVEEYVLLSALLHDQSCLQSSPCFQHQFVWLLFSRTLVCKGGCSFHVHGEHESRVFEPVLRCRVTRA